MFDIDPPTVIAAISLVLGGTGTVAKWAHNRITKVEDELSDCDKRIAVTEQAFTDLKELINTRFDSTDARLERVERKVLNGDYRPSH